MVMKSTNTYKRLRLSYIIYIVCLLHVSATFVAILRKVHYKGCITQRFAPLHKYKLPSVKMCGLKYLLKYKILINFW